MIGRLVDRLALSPTEGTGSLLAALCINAFGAGMFYPFALLFFSEATSLSVGRIGLILTIATLVTLSVTPITGALVDRFGPLRPVIASQLLGASGFAMYLLVSSATTLFLASLVVTAAARMFFASFSTLVAQSAATTERDRWYGLVGVTQTLTASVSGFLASLVIATTGMGGFRAVIVLNACCLLLAGWLLRRMPELRQAPVRSMSDHGYREVVRDAAFVKIVASNALFVLCSMLPGLGLAVYAVDGLGAPLWAVGALGVVQTGLTLGCQGPVLRKVRSHRRTRVMLGAGCIWVLACVLYAAAAAIPAIAVVPWLFVAAAVFTVAQLLYIPTARALAAGMGPEALQGRYIAAYEFSWGLAAALGPLLFGVAFDLFPPAPWLVMTGLVLIAIAILRSAAPGIEVTSNRSLTTEPASRQQAPHR